VLKDMVLTRWVYQKSVIDFTQNRPCRNARD
jgi:hypothetical protein